MVHDKCTHLKAIDLCLYINSFYEEGELNVTNYSIAWSFIQKSCNFIISCIKDLELIL